MNRRNFLKRIAAVAAGSVIVPTAIKKLPWTSYSMTYKFKPNPAQRRILSNDEVAKRYTVLPCLHETHQGEPGDRVVCHYCGRHYTFVQMKGMGRC